jgi:hypothetical protein
MEPSETLIIPEDIMRGIEDGVVQIKRKWDLCWKDHEYETLNGVITELDHDSQFRIRPECVTSYQNKE